MSDNRLISERCQSSPFLSLDDAMKTEHTIEWLFRRLTVHFGTTVDYHGLEPSHQEPFSRSTAFFPGGYGLWGISQGKPLPAMPRHGIMILGNDFGKRLGSRGELNGPTWRGLTNKVKDSSKNGTISAGVLDEAGVDLSKCFFTNAYMGIRSGGPQKGPSSALLELDSRGKFLAKCLAFFKDQLRAQEPTLIVSLGTFVPPFIELFRNGNLPSESSIRSLKLQVSLERFNNENGISLLRYELPMNKAKSAILLFLTHPSHADLNRKNRAYGNFDAKSGKDEATRRSLGRSAEIAMLRDAIKRAGIKAS